MKIETKYDIGQEVWFVDEECPRTAQIEAFDYAEKSDTRFETPQYASIKPHYGEYVTLFGVNKSQKTIVNNQNIIVDGVIHGYNVEITNTTLNSGADITIEASKAIVIGANTKILKGSTLKTE